MSVKIENLTYIYNKKAPFEKKALNDISMHIEEGDFFGIIGHTGSGKSTLISHINGLKKIMKGSVVVSGIDLTKKYDYKQLRSTAGMVFQYPEYQLFDESVRKDVGFGPKNLRIEEGEIERRVKEAIELVGLDYEEIKERSPFELSGGQMRRVALAGVLAMKPKILILDEPTAGLDPIGKKQILSLIHSIKKECPTVIMISHNMDEIFTNCNKIALLSEGELKGVYTPEQLFKNSDIIEENGLLMPFIFNLAKKLNENGYNIDSFSNEKQFIEQIVSQFRGRQNA